MICKLKTNGIYREIKDLVSNCLDNCIQQVLVLNGQKFLPKEVTAGVLRGSVLATHLLLIHIHGMGDGLILNQQVKNLVDDTPRFSKVLNSQTTYT